MAHARFGDGALWGLLRGVADEVGGKAIKTSFDTFAVEGNDRVVEGFGDEFGAHEGSGVLVKKGHPVIILRVAWALVGNEGKTAAGFSFFDQCSLDGLGGSNDGAGVFASGFNDFVEFAEVQWFVKLHATVLNLIGEADTPFPVAVVTGESDDALVIIEILVE